jgi:glycogen debranching enzyme
MMAHIATLGPASQSHVDSPNKWELLAAPELSGGYGLRTMSTLDGAYDPLTYHCGSIWPHDTQLRCSDLRRWRPTRTLGLPSQSSPTDC